jgi:DNA-binding transcriptional LysR family regulator
MDLRQIRTFRAVAELGSLSSASDRLRIAQPALSRQIRLLEHELKTALFVRHGRGMALTDAGRLFFERTTLTVRQLEQACEDVMSASGGITGRVVIGMVPTIGSALARPVARRVVDDHPGIRLRIVEAYGSYLVEWLHRGEIDMAVVYGPATAVHLEAHSLRTDDLLAVAASGSGLAQLQSVGIEWLAERPLVLPSAPHALRMLVDAEFARRSLDPDVIIEANSFGALVDIVADGVGVSILPFYAIASLVGGPLEAARLRPALERELILAYPPRLQQSHAARAVGEILQIEAQTLPDLP